MAVKRLLSAILALALVGSGAPEAAWAQKPIPETVRMMAPFRLRIGDYVRVWPGAPAAPGTTAAPGAGADVSATVAGGPTLEGPIVGFSFSTLTLAGPPDDATLVDLSTAHRLEVRRRETHYKRAALIGAGLGVVASLFVATRELLGHDVGAWERVGWTVGLTAGGAVLGLGVARVARRERWEPVDLVTLRPHPADAGPALRFQWAFRL